MKTVKDYVRSAIYDCNFKNNLEKTKTVHDDFWLVACLETAMREYAERLIDSCIEQIDIQEDKVKLRSSLEKLKKELW